MEWSVDPRNPAEVFACAGLAHLAWREDRAARAGFARVGDGWRFRAPDLSAAFGRLAGAAPGETAEGLRLGGIELDWWREWGLNPGLKLWAGRQRALTVHRSLAEAAGAGDPADWPAFAAPAGGRLNLDLAGSWNALELGWSPNEHTNIRVRCRPWTELLASIGLQAFPVRGGAAEGFLYGLWRPAPLPAALAAFAGRGRQEDRLARYRTRVGWAGSNKLLRLAAPA